MATSIDKRARKQRRLRQKRICRAPRLRKTGTTAKPKFRRSTRRKRKQQESKNIEPIHSLDQFERRNAPPKTPFSTTTPDFGVPRAVPPKANTSFMSKSRWHWESKSRRWTGNKVASFPLPPAAPGLSFIVLQIPGKHDNQKLCSLCRWNTLIFVGTFRTLKNELKQHREKKKPSSLSSDAPETATSHESASFPSPPDKHHHYNCPPHVVFDPCRPHELHRRSPSTLKEWKRIGEPTIVVLPNCCTFSWPRSVTMHLARIGRRGKRSPPRSLHLNSAETSNWHHCLLHHHPLGHPEAPAHTQHGDVCFFFFRIIQIIPQRLRTLTWAWQPPGFLHFHVPTNWQVPHA